MWYIQVTGRRYHSSSWSDADLSEDKQCILKDLIRRYLDVFKDMPGETDVIQHRVKLKDNTLIRCKPYPLPYAKREELRNEVDSMLEMREMRPSTFCIIMVKKKDGSNRVCVDYRKSNIITKVEPMMMAEEIPVQDRFDQRILTDTICSRGCVQNSVCDSRWTI